MKIIEVIQKIEEGAIGQNPLSAQEEQVEQEENRAAIDRANLKRKKADIGIAKLQKKKLEAAQTSAEHQP